MIVFEIESYPEPKSLIKADLAPLLAKLGGVSAVVATTGLGATAVQERLKPTRRWDAKLKKFVAVGTVLKLPK